MPLLLLFKPNPLRRASVFFMPLQLSIRFPAVIFQKSRLLTHSGFFDPMPIIGRRSETDTCKLYRGKCREQILNRGTLCKPRMRNFIDGGNFADYNKNMEQMLHPVISVRLFTDEKCFGPGVAQLLRHVESLHSLRSAAIAMGMAYSKAWTVLKTSQKALGYPLLYSTTGGKNGGGAVLTPEAKKLLAAYEEYCSALNTYGQELFAEKFAEFLAR